MPKTIYQELREAGVPVDHHESDLYAKATPEARAIVARYPYPEAVTTFRSNIDGTPWLDIPFAYDPFWDGKAR